MGYYDPPDDPEPIVEQYCNWCDWVGDDHDERHENCPECLMDISEREKKPNEPECED